MLLLLPLESFWTRATGPWWLTLLGVLIGGALSFTIAVYVDRSKAKREARDKWISQVQSTSAQLVSQAWLFIQAVHEAKYKVNNAPLSTQEVLRRDLESELTRHMAVLPSTCATLEFLRTGRIAELAREYVALLVRGTRGSDWATNDNEFDKWGTDVGDKGNEFTRAVSLVTPASVSKYLPANFGST